MNQLSQLQQMKAFYQTQATFGIDFRKDQLGKLKSGLLKYEREIYDALFADLKKLPEDIWVTELGFVIAEIGHAIRHLRKWMKPKRTKTNLLNLPSSSYIYKEPLGIVLIIGPWNYPLQLLLNPLVGAIAAGNCAVVKPSESAPATAAVLKKVIEEYFPKEYILYVEGEGSEVVPALMNQFRFDHVFYTGNTSVGRIIYEMAAKKLVPVTLELGGKSPCVVESDANIGVAARRIAITKFSNAGQMCVAPDYVLAHYSIKDELVDALKKNIGQFYSAGSFAEFGKIINEKNFTRIISYLREGRIVHGGQYNAETRFIEPAILEDISLDTAIMGDEIFGPVLPVITFQTTDEAKQIINRNPDPLAFYIFTGSSKKEKQWLEGVSFGGGCVNNASWHLTNFHLPFGGRGNSGIGSYHGKYSFDTFSHHKAVMKTPTWFDPNIKYPPFKGKLGLFKKIVR